MEGKNKNTLSVYRLIAPVLLVVLLIASIAPANSEEKDEYYCHKCKNTGRVKSKLPAKYKDFPFLSSVVVENKSGCCGLGWLPCPNKKCKKRIDALREFEEKTAPLKKWLSERRRLVEERAFSKNKRLCGIKALHASTEHFHLSGTFKSRNALIEVKGRFKKKHLNPEQSLHLYAHRIEAVCERYLKLIGHKGAYKPIMVDKFTVMLWETKAQADAVSFAFCGFENAAGASTAAVVFTTLDDVDDLFMHHKIAFAVANLLTEDYGAIVEYFPFWFKEAVSHWIEYDIFQELRIFSAGEVDFTANCPQKGLKEILKKAVKGKSKRLVPLRDFVNKNAMDHTGWERVKAWSIIDWMINGYGKQSVRLLLLDFKKHYPKSKQQAPSIRNVFSMTFEEIDEAWAEWVLATYK